MRINSIVKILFVYFNLKHKRKPHAIFHLISLPWAGSEVRTYAEPCSHALLRILGVHYPTHLPLAQQTFVTSVLQKSTLVLNSHSGSLTDSFFRSCGQYGFSHPSTQENSHLSSQHLVSQFLEYPLYLDVNAEHNFCLDVQHGIVSLFPSCLYSLPVFKTCIGHS